ncbi:MAG: hypothetical protein ACE5GJ_09020 [Gemmatimonadota bacterium]
MITNRSRIPLRILALAAFLGLPLTSSACGNSGDRQGRMEAPGSAAAGAANAVASQAGPAAGTAATQTVSGLELARELEVYHANEPIPGVITAGQVTPEQFDALAKAGYKTFVSLRLPTERGAGWEEEHAPEVGVSFVRIPIGGPDDLTEEAARRLDRVLKEAEEEGGAVVYCGSSNRVGALMALRARWVEGKSPEEALELGKKAGMTRLEPEVRRLLGL